MSSDKIEHNGQFEEQAAVEVDRQAQPVDAELPPNLQFPVVGIGASAGGLEAMTEFLSAVHVESGMAYILVQHLPPTGESMLADILRKHVKIPVVEVDDGMSVQANHLYVIRPGFTLTIKDGVLHLGERVTRPMGNRPVDDFFKSLAEEQRERAIAVILSGMGSNGAAGSQAIKAVGGLCVAQDPESAKFPSMPRHLIEAGYADYILRPRDIPDILLAYAQHPYASGEREQKAALAKRDQQHLREVLAILRTRTRQDFNGYKKPTVLRRIQRRMGLSRVTKIGEYAKLLRQTPGEVIALADDLLIHVTGFFRDPEAWEKLRTQVIVPLVSSRESGSSIRCWVTACSSGEEAYTLAILLVEEAERVEKSLDIKVFATDMADRTLQNARNGVYPGGIESEIEPRRLQRFFLQEDEVYRVRQELRERVVFAPQNVLQDPPFSRLDIATCRNLLIYLEPEMQLRILSLLHFGLREGGTLFLGTSETAGSDELFQPIDKKARIYRRVGATRHGSVDFPLPNTTAARRKPEESSSAELRMTGPRPTIAQMTTRGLLEQHVPAAVTIDRDRRIIFYHGNTDPFFTSPRGEPTRDVMQLARESVRGAIRTALQRAASGSSPATVLDGWLDSEPETRLRVAVTASYLDPRNAPDHLIISFQTFPDMTTEATAVDSNGNGSDAVDELRRVRDELQSTIEELQTSNEELKATHEEVVSTNEELQSSNEEMETSREEMQSLNEELTTVNSQLHSKMEEHQAARNDLSSLLTSTNIAVLFLDSRFRIRRFTPAVRDLIEMISSDIGRPITDLARNFTDANLVNDCRTVLERLVPIETEVVATNGSWFLRRVTPYRTDENRIDGVVITFVNITARLKAEQAIRASEQQFRRAIEDAPIPIIMYAQDGEVLQVSGVWEDLTTYTQSDMPTIDAWLSRASGPGVEVVRSCLHEHYASDRKTFEVELTIRTRSDENRVWSFSVSSPGNLQDGRRYHVGMAVDITERKRSEEALRDSEDRLRAFVEGARDFAMIMLNPVGRVAAWNVGAEHLLGYTEAEIIGQPGAIIFTPEDRAIAAADQEMQQAASSGSAKDERWHLRKDQTRFWGSGVMTALRASDESLRGFVKILRDETPRKLAENAMQAAKEAAETANRTKDLFLATLSHELRTPLNAIVGWTSILKGGDPTAEEVQEGIEVIDRNAQAQSKLIEDVLDVSRIVSGKLKMQLVSCELPLVVEAAMDVVRPAADIKEVEIAAELDFTRVAMMCDVDRMQQIIWNLLANAVKFTPKGGRVVINLSRKSSHIVIRVSDNGQGIHPDFLPYIFDRFRQADSSSRRRFGGLGLGLSIVKHLVELHGGTVSAQSPGEGLGSTFTVRLPVRAVYIETGLEERQAAKETYLLNLPKVRLDAIRILVVDDEPDARQVLTKVLERAGATVGSAGSAREALALIAKNLPRILVSDIGMPEIDGLDLLRQIRSNGISAKALPAIALTAYAQEADVQEALQAGFQFHVPKPVEPNSLIRTVFDLLGSAEILNENGVQLNE
jgi:two-component system CheB/CheR fusion protein